MILTHACRLKDFNHTSYAEIRSFEEILKSNMIFRAVEIRDYSELEHVAYAEDLTIFAAGKDMHETIVSLANTCKNLYIVVQDPNWPTSLSQIKRDFTLITPFRALEGLEVKATKRQLKYAIPTLSTKYITDHRVIDFGSMLAYNERYVERYWENAKETSKRSKLPCYVGSLKEDRIGALSSIAREEGVSFYGNFIFEDFARMSGSRKGLEKCKFNGRIAPTDVLSVYLAHEEVIFCPDDKIFDLDTSYLRIGEMCLANAKPIIVSKRKDILYSLDHLIEEDGRLSWSKFVKDCGTRDLIAQIKSAYREVI